MGSNLAEMNVVRDEPRRSVPSHILGPDCNMPTNLRTFSNVLWWREALILAACLLAAAVWGTLDVLSR